VGESKAPSHQIYSYLGIGLPTKPKMSSIDPKIGEMEVLPMKRNILLTLLTLSTTITHAHFYRYALWGYKDEQGQTQFVHTLSAVHYRGGTNKKQQHELITAVPQKCGKENSLFIVEDIAEFASPGALYITAPDFIEQKCSLMGLEQKGRQNSLNISNVEFRQCAALTHYCEYNKSIFISSIFTHILKNYLTTLDRTIQDTYSYQDEPILNTFYEKSRSAGAHERTLLRQMLTSPQNPLIRIFDGGRSLKDIIVDSATSILDIQTMHVFAKNRDKKHIFICEGGSHIERIEEIFPQLGFKKLIEVGKSLESGRGLEAIKIKELFNDMPDNFDTLLANPDQFQSQFCKFKYLERPAKPRFSEHGISYYICALTGLFGLISGKLTCDISNWYNARTSPQAQTTKPTTTQSPSQATTKQPQHKSSDHQRRHITTQAAPALVAYHRPTQLHRSTPPTIHPAQLAHQIRTQLKPKISFMPRNFRLGALGLSLGALGVYAWLRGQS